MPVDVGLTEYEKTELGVSSTAEIFTQRAFADNRQDMSPDYRYLL